MKVFISHKQEDAYIANNISMELKKCNVPFYLDVLDDITEDGKALTDHIKENLNSCTDIIVVMSPNTYKSQWVPFEVGMSAQRDMPTATFLEKNIKLPDFLDYWPRLKTLSDIHKYIDTKKQIDEKYARNRYGGIFENAENRSLTKTEMFYRALKENL